MSVETTPINMDEARPLVMTPEGRREVMNRMEFDLTRTAARLRGMAQAHLVLGNDLVAQELLNTVAIIEEAYPLFLMIHCATLQDGNDAMKRANATTLKALLHGASPEIQQVITASIESP